MRITAILPLAHLCNYIPLIAQLILPHEVSLLKLHLPQNGHVGVNPDPEERRVSTADVTRDKHIEGEKSKVPQVNSRRYLWVPVEAGGEGDMSHVDVMAKQVQALFISARCSVALTKKRLHFCKILCINIMIGQQLICQIEAAVVSYSMADKSMSTSSPFIRGIFFFLFLGKETIRTERISD